MFVTYEFLLFAAVLFILYYLIPRRFQWVLLLIANFLFYFYAGTWYPIFILVTSFTVYVAGVRMGRLDERLADYRAEIKSGRVAKPSREEQKKYKARINRRKKRWMLLCLLLNLGILAVLKYTNFALENANALLEAFGKSACFDAGRDIILPMGISFYTFQAVGYLLDVYWNKCEPQKNFFRFTLFVSFFPQLIQGPISRYGDLSETLYEEHKADFKQIRFGLERMLWGYFKKLVIADRISVAVMALTEDWKYYHGAYVVILMVFYAIQLYSDFTGGIDITIGIAQVLGIRVKENFIRPFFSKNIAEYWRRWHISMGTWFRDYVFYPFSISRANKSLTKFCKKHFGMAAQRRAAVYVSTVIVWLTTGIWHGADWHFVAWGLTNGVVILISEELSPLYERFHKKLPGLGRTAWYRGFQVIRTFALMCCIRLFDNYGSVKVTIRQFIHMFTRFDFSRVSKKELLSLGMSAADYMVVLAGVILMFAVSMYGRNGSVREKIAAKPYWLRYAVFVAMFFAVLLLGTYGVGYDARQFIYNQF